MVTNRFRGHFNTDADFDNARTYGLLPGVFAELDVVGDLSEAGAGTDTGANEDYSSTATWFSFKATADSVIHRMVLNISVSTLTGSAAQDLTLWLGGAAALTNGIKWGISTASTGSPDTYASDAAKTMSQFSSEWGADIFRDSYTVDATAGDNHDHLVVTLDFVRMFGLPIRLPKNYYIGVYLNDDLSGLGALTGIVTGRFIYD